MKAFWTYEMLGTQEPTPTDAAPRITVADLDAMAGDRPPAAPGRTEHVSSDAPPSGPAPLGDDVPAGPAPEQQQSVPNERQPSPAALGSGCVIGVPVHIPQVQACSPSKLLVEDALLQPDMVGMIAAPLYAALFPALRGRCGTACHSSAASE